MNDISKDFFQNFNLYGSYSYIIFKYIFYAVELEVDFLNLNLLISCFIWLYFLCLKILMFLYKNKMEYIEKRENVDKILNIF